ncbi:alpha/beta fold hydrolase [Sorangium sp. So ce429]
MITQTVLRVGLLPVVLGLTAFAAGCSGGDDQASPGTNGDGGSGGSSAVEWGGCPGDFISECATVALPLDPSKPGGETLPVFVSRHLAPGGAAKAQVWLLQGGPGDSGNMFTGFIEQLWERVMPDVDWYVLEHRGVGLSSRFECPVQEDPSSEDEAEISASEWPACVQALKAQWGDDLAHFTTSADADDLARLIERTREHGKKVILYGASYGTARALRFLQKYPEAVDAVILDSIVGGRPVHAGAARQLLAGRRRRAAGLGRPGEARGPLRAVGGTGPDLGRAPGALRCAARLPGGGAGDRPAL